MLNYVLTANFIFNMNLDQNSRQRMNAFVGKYLHISLRDVLYYLIFTCVDPVYPYTALFWALHICLLTQWIGPFGEHSSELLTVL
jgi:hypothetical protein